MFGAIYAAYVVIQQPEIGSLSNLISHPNVVDKISFFPDLSNPSILISMFIIPIAVQWWAVWYPGSEPGGGGYIAQRMLAAKDEENAMGATLLFNVAHYALRPWPWIIVALGSLILYPDLMSIKQEFPNIADQYLGDDIAYPVMLTKLGPGWLGLVVASLIAAFMSTISTHLNWGASYLVSDFYQRFVRPEASEKELVQTGRVATIILMIFSASLALTILEDATQAFDLLLLSGAGSGAIYLLRWFWWRINAWTEIAAMISATIVAIVLVFWVPDEIVATTLIDGSTVKLLIAVCITTLVWIGTTFVTKPESMEVLISFYKKVHPGGPGWQKVIDSAKQANVELDVDNTSWDLPISLLNVFLGCIGIYSALFAIGYFVYGNFGMGQIFAGIFGMSIYFMLRTWPKMNLE